jgi:LmbE family N-acetylglucosaminyl deacetylase
VFSCGDLLAAHPGSTVVTVFAGGPRGGPALASWDEAGGFAPGDDVIAARRREDAAALRVLDARPMWLSFWDSQYAGAARVEDLRHAVEQAIMAAEPDTVCLPLGLWHSDHRLTHEATQPLASRHPGLAWLAYADAIYRRFPDAGLLDRLEGMARASLAPIELAIPSREASPRKCRAVACYRSQLRALATPGRPGTADVFEGERYWRLRPPNTSPT